MRAMTDTAGGILWFLFQLVVVVLAIIGVLALLALKYGVLHVRER